jgi:hypothetical protein
MSSTFPDPGAHIKVFTRAGCQVEGFVHPGHVWAGDEFICLSDSSRTDGENLYHYVRIQDIESWVWDCRS